MKIKLVLIACGMLAIALIYAISMERGKSCRSNSRPLPATETLPAPKPPDIVPAAKIAIDGKDDDWASVPDFITLKPDPRMNRYYDCRAVRLARDEQNLYVLFILGRGIRERLDAYVRANGKARSGALGYLKLTTEGEKFSLWIPTGFHLGVKSDGTPAKPEPIVDFELSRQEPQGKTAKVLYAGSRENPDMIGFDGRCLELKIPLEKMGVGGTAGFIIELNEM